MGMRVLGLFLLGLLFSPSRAQQPNVGAITVFPADNPWNWDISGHNVHPLSTTYINSNFPASQIRADFAMEINVVSGGATTQVNFGGSADESDAGPGFGSDVVNGAPSGQYRFPVSPRVEGGGDAHCISVDTVNGLLYETYQMNLATSPWSATNGAVFNLNTNDLRPDGWTSGDAAGLPIFPGVLRYEEIVAGSINHALRVTVPNSQNAHLYPARHHAGSANTSYPPMGLRLRLKASKDISGFSGAPRIVMDALKKYGLIVADNGTQWYISTTVDDRWDQVMGIPYINSTTQGLRALLGSDLEAVETVDALGNPILPGAVPPPTPPAGGGGGGGGGGCGATGLESLFLLAGALLLRRAFRVGCRS